MEPWQKDFWQIIDAVNSEAEQFFDGIVEIVEEIVTEVDLLMTEAVEPILELCLGLESVVGEAAQPIVQTVQPILEEHPACVGCRYYYGQIHGGNLLVCAMHPYGWDSAPCPDWQTTWNNQQ